MNETELQDLMAADESEGLEFKSSLLSRKEIGEYAVGIGNQGGGHDTLAESVGKSWEEVLDPVELSRLRRVLIDNFRDALTRLKPEELLRSSLSKARDLPSIAQRRRASPSLCATERSTVLSRA
jgi:hypothetical protein